MCMCRIEVGSGWVVLGLAVFFKVFITNESMKPFQNDIRSKKSLFL